MPTGVGRSKRQRALLWFTNLFLLLILEFHHHTVKSWSMDKATQHNSYYYRHNFITDGMNVPTSRLETALYESSSSSSASRMNGDKERKSYRNRKLGGTKKAPRRDAPSRKDAILWTLNSIENSDTDDVSLSTLAALRELYAANNKSQVLSAGRKLEMLDLERTESANIRERIVKICALSGLMPLASKIFDSLVVTDSFLEETYVPSSMAYLPLLSTYRKMGKTSKVEEYFMKIAECYKLSNMNSTISVYAFNIYVGSLVDSGAYDRVLELLKPDMSRDKFGVLPDIVSYNTLLSATVRKNDFEILDEALSLLEESGLKRDIYTINSQLRAAVTRNQDELSISLIDDVLSSPHIRHDFYFVDNSIIPLLDANRTKDVYKLINDFQFRGNKDRFSALLSTLAKSDRHRGEAQQLFETFVLNENSSRKIAPNLRHFNILLAGYKAELDYEGAKDTIKTMLRTGIQPDEYTMTTFMGVMKSPRMLRKLWKAGTRHFNIQMTPTVITAYITELGRVGDVRTACQIFDVIHSNGVFSKKVQIWNALLNVFAKNSSSVPICLLAHERGRKIVAHDNAIAAKRLLQYMKEDENSPRPNSVSYCLVAAAYAKSDEGQNPIYAMELFRDALERGIYIEGRFVNAVIRSFGGEVDAAVEAWKNEIAPAIRLQMKDGRFRKKSRYMRNIDITAVYNGLLTVCGRGRRADLALRFVYAMKKEGVEPTETQLQCYNAGKRQADLKSTTKFSLSTQFETLLAVECTKYIKSDVRRKKDKKIKIIF